MALASCTHLQNKKSFETANFETISYAKNFGIAHFKDYSQLFEINNQDTFWGFKCYKNSKKLKIVVLSSVFASYFNELKAQSYIIGIDQIDYYNDSILVKMHQNNQIVEVSKTLQIDEVKLLSLKPDLIIGSSFENINKGFSERLKRANIQFVKCDNFKEQHPLARAEWIKYFGAMIGELNLADSLFKTIENNYYKIQKTIDKSSIPLVMTDIIFDNQWHVPGGKSYTAQLIKDAGGQYVFEKDSLYFSYGLHFESVFNNAKNADIWIHLGTNHSKNELKNQDSRYIEFKAFKTNNLYNYNKRENQKGGNDFWEKGVVRPDLILNDLSIIFGKDKKKINDLFFYKQLN